MKTVSFQGTQLSAGQRRQIEAQQRLSGAFLNPHLRQVVDQGIAELERQKAAGVTPSDDHKYRLDYATKGTPWLGDVFGY